MRFFVTTYLVDYLLKGITITSIYAFSSRHIMHRDCMYTFHFVDLIDCRAIYEQLIKHIYWNLGVRSKNCLLLLLQAIMQVFETQWNLCKWLISMSPYKQLCRNFYWGQHASFTILNVKFAPLWNVRRSCFIMIWSLSFPP